MFDIEKIESTVEEYSVMDGMDVYTVIHEGGADYMAYGSDGKPLDKDFGAKLIDEVHQFRIK